MSPKIGRNLGGFHHRVACYLENIHTRRYMTGSWVYPPLDKAMVAVGLEGVDIYFLCHYNTVTQYIATWPIL